MSKPFRDINGAYVYLIECADGSYYCGSTRKPIDERFAEHQAAAFPFCYTAPRRPLRLAWCEHFPVITDAIAYERRIKGWSRAKKQALIAGNWRELQRLAVAYERRQAGIEGFFA